MKRLSQQEAFAEGCQEIRELAQGKCQFTLKRELDTQVNECVSLSASGLQDVIPSGDLLEGILSASFNPLSGKCL